jgi:hypothetical protein
MWKNLAVLVLSTILSAGVAELLIRNAVLPLPDYFESSGWWNEHWQRKQRGGTPRRFVKLDPDLGWVPAPNLDRLPYEGAELSTNSASIRGRREYVPGPSKRTRIVAIGDSFMFGQCLDDDETGPARLEAHLPGTEVVNLGVMAYGHGQMRLRRDGLAYEPDLVVLGFHPWDITRNRLEFRDYAKPRFVLDNGELRLTNVPVPDPDHYARRTLRVANYLRMLWDVFRKDELAAEDRELTLALTRAIAEESAAAGARFALVYLPVKDEVEDDPIPLDFLAAECAAQGWLCIGPAPRILETWPRRRDYKKHFDCHHSAPLADLIAGLTAERIRAQWPELVSDGRGEKSG